MSNLTNLIAGAKIGQPHENVVLSSRAENGMAACALAEKAKHEILIISRHLDQLVYGTEEFVSVLSPFIRSKRASLRILVSDTERLVKHSHRLGEFAMAISSKVSIRKLGARQASYNEAWMLADGVALLHLPRADAYQGSLDFYSPRKGRELSALFEEMWDHATLVPDLRVLKI